MTDVVGKLWGYASTLRHDGVDYGDYIEQLTYLLFLKMADEQGIVLPTYVEAQDGGRLSEIPCDWPYLRKQSGTVLVEHYAKLLSTLGKQHGILGDIFSGSQNRLANPATLARLIKVIDETEWTSLDVDVKAAAFEGLLEKSAAEGKKGAGQYFTPRPLIRSMVRVIKPDPRVHKQFAICDPACGTGGFLVAAYEWLKDATGGALDRETAKRVKTSTYYGQELVARPRRLALMNMYLHQVEPHIALGDSIYEAPNRQRYDVVLTNPPFGNRGANQVPVRDDFTIETANKQLNFLQHVLTILKPGGRAASWFRTTYSSPTRLARSSRYLWKTLTSTQCCVVQEAHSIHTPPAPRRMSSSSPKDGRPVRYGCTTRAPTCRPLPRNLGH